MSSGPEGRQNLHGEVGYMTASVPKRVFPLESLESTGGSIYVNLSRDFAVWHTRHMKTLTSSKPYKNHRFAAEIISHGVWLYYRFCLSYRDVEELLFVRGVIVSYEAIRK
jgi:hypothetical protein